MPEPGSEAPKPRVETGLPPEQRSPREADVRLAAQPILRDRIPQNPTEQSLKADKVGSILFAAQVARNIDQEQLDNMTEDTKTRAGDRELDPEEKGMLFPPEPDPVKGPKPEDGNAVHVSVDRISGANIVGQEPVRIAQITGVKGEMVVCRVTRGRGNSETSWEDVSIPREAVFQAALVSERSALEQGWEDGSDNQAIVKGYLDSIDPSVNDPSLPDKETISRVIEQANSDTVPAKDAEALIALLPPSMQNHGEVAEIKKRLQGRVVASKEDFAAVVTLSGRDVDWYDQEIVKVRKDSLKARTKLSEMDADDPNRAAKAAELADLEHKEKVFNQATGTILESQQEAENAALERENGPLGEIDDAIELRAKELAVKINTITELQKRLNAQGQKLSHDQAEELQSALSMVELFDSVKGLEGPIGVLARNTALNQAIKHGRGKDGKGEVGSTALKRMERLNGKTMDLAKEQAQKEFRSTLEDAGVNMDQIDSALKLLDTPEGIAEFLNENTKNEKIKQLQENTALSEALIGGNSTEAIDNFLAKAEATLSEEDKKKLEKAKGLLKIGGITVGGLAMLLLALTGVTMSFVAKGMSSDGRAA